MQIGEEKRKLLQDHPEYVRQVDEIAFAPVYQDELGQLLEVMKRKFGKI